MEEAKEERDLKKHLVTVVVLIAVTACSGLAAKTKAKPAPKQPVVSYPVVMQSTGTFDEGKQAEKIAIFAAPDEMEPASFTLMSSKAFSGLYLKVGGDLVNGKSKLPMGQVKLSAVTDDRLEAPGTFDLPAGEPKRFWMTVNVPLRTTPGLYKGAIVAVAGGKAVGKLPVELNVLSLRLLKSSKQYGILLPDAASNNPDELNAIKDNGFGLTSTAAPVEALTDALAAIKSSGLSTTVPYTCQDLTEDSIKVAEDQARAAGGLRLLYGAAYQPKTEEQITAAAATAEIIKKARLKSFAVLDDPTAFDALAPNIDNLDCDVNLPYMQGLLSGEKRAMGRHEWWYWDISRNAKDNRLYAGLLLWKSGLDGAFPPVGTAGSGDSVIGTIRWEALREGIDDTRYITSMMNLLREAKDLHKGKDVTDAAEAYLNAVLAKPLAELTDNDYQAIRWKLAQYIIKLQPYTK